MTDYEENKSINKPFTLFNNETGQSIEIPILSGTEGPNVLDIRSLYKETGMFTYDPGFTSTASCESSITYIDGNKGILRHRGYDINDLATNSDFLEVCYLLLHGDLPSPTDKIKFENIDENKDGYYPDIGVTKLYILGKEIIKLLKYEDGFLKV